MLVGSRGRIVLPTTTVGSSQITDGSIAVGDLASATTIALLGLRHLPIGGYVTADATQGTVVGGGATVDPADYAVTGRTAVYTLSVVGSVVSGQTLTVVLYDLTAASAAATLTWTETSATRKTASVTAPGSAHIYELRVSCSGGTAAHYGVAHTANLRITWS